MKEPEGPTDRAARRTATATVWIAVFTVILAAANLLTLWEVKQGGSDTHELAAEAKRQADNIKDVSDAADKIKQAAQDMVVQEQRIADNARSALDASNLQNKTVLSTTVKTAQLDQRAWLVVKRIEGKLQIDQPWEIHIVFTNTGKTPARNARVSCFLDRQKSEQGIAFSTHEYGGEPSLLAPADELYCSLNALDKTGLSNVNQPILDMLNRKEVVVFARGFVIYDDVFGKSHWLTFCRAMHSDGTAWDSCKTHNDTGDGENPPN